MTTITPEEYITLIPLLIQENKNIKVELNELKNKTQNLIDFNTILPHDINKHLKIMRNDIEDTRDHLDRIDEDIDKKITSKQEVLRLRNKIKNLEESVNINKLKCLDVEDSILGIEKNIIH